jgi:hypothetical protein
MVQVEMPEGVSYEGVFGKEARIVRMSPTQMPPGDPIIYIKGGRDFEQVTAIFPFGKTLPLYYDPHTSRWMGVFLVPKDVPDATYKVQIVATLRNGEQERFETTYCIDTRPPDIEVKIAESLPKTKDMVPIEVTGSRDISKVIVRGWNGETIRLRRKEGGKFYGSLAIPEATESGKYKVEITAYDYAQNKTKKVVIMELSEKVRFSVKNTCH